MFKLNSVEILCVVLGINPRALHGAFSPLLMKYFKSVVSKRASLQSSVKSFTMGTYMLF